MADVETSVFRIVSSYGGLKTAYIEVASMDSADVLKLTDDNVVGVKYIDLYEEDDTSGRAPLSFARNTWDGTTTFGNELTLKTAAKTGIKVSGIIMYRSYPSP